MHEYGETYLNLGGSQEFAAVATPQQVGVSERDSVHLTVIVRGLPKDGGFSKSLWSGMFFIPHMFPTGLHILP